MKRRKEEKKAAKESVLVQEEVLAGEVPSDEAVFTAVDMVEGLSPLIIPAPALDPRALVMIPSVWIDDPVEDPVGEIQFGNLVFRDGINTTVRRGSKWDGARGVYTAVGEDDRRTIVIHDTLMMPFTEVSSWILLHFEHDPVCRNFYQLFEEMKRSYPAATPTTQGGFTMDEEVTVVFFTAIGT